MPSTRLSFSTTSVSAYSAAISRCGTCVDDAVDVAPRAPPGGPVTTVTRRGSRTAIAAVRGLLDALEPDRRIALDRGSAAGAATFGSTASGDGEDLLVDPVAHEVARRVGAQLGERALDPARLGDERHRQVERQRRADALGVVGLVEAVLERLHEVRVALAPARVKRLNVVSHHVATATSKRWSRASSSEIDVQVREVVVARPVRQVPVAHEHERDVHAVVGGQPAGVADDDADAAAQLQVVDEEGDLHDDAGGSSRGAGRSRSPFSSS